MKPTEILSSEHRIIEQVLDCVEAIAAQAHETSALDVDSARKAIEFLKNFADKCHHGKEEERLFPLMESKGFSPDFGPTGVMRSEHAQGREQIKGMEQALNDFEGGNADGVNAYIRNAQAYVALLRQHINKEDHCLFSMADSAFSPEDQVGLLKSFEEFEIEDMGSGEHERFLRLADCLADKLGVAKVSAENRAHSDFCSHH